MQYIDNDMDDLFKKAGENYPLQTDGANWDAVQAKLADSNDEAAIYPAKKINRNYLWLLLLLLLPLVMVTHKTDNATISKIPNLQNRENAVFAKPDATLSDKAGTRRSVAGVIGDASNNMEKNNSEANANSNKSRSGHSSLNRDFSETVDSKKPISNPPATENHRKDQVKEKQLPAGDKSGDENSNWNNASLPETIPSLKGESHSAQQPQSDSLAGQTEAASKNSTTAIRQPKELDSVSILEKDTAMAKRLLPEKARHKKNGFYYGIVAGPDASTIKSQKVTNIGYGAGVVLGYKIDRHWAVEAGALWDEKKYYTKGEYFDKTGANIPSSVTVHYLEGGCNMFEFPIAVRYDLNIKRNSFFVTGGITSYIMKKESYNYGADNNGDYYEGYKTYKNSVNHLLSNLQLSAGYKYNLSPKLSLRVEPYIKMPVKGIGIGRMPVNSKGVYVGIMRSIR